MTASIVGSFGNQSQTLVAAGSLGTLPAGISDGDLGVCVISSQNTTITLSVLPSGWTVIDSLAQASNVSTFLLTKTLTAADSSTTPTYTASAAARLASAGFVLTGASLDTVSSVASQTSFSNNMLTPTITPVANNCIQVMMGGASFASGTGWAGFTPAAGWTEDQDLGQGTTGVNVGSYAAHKQLTGQAGVLQAAATFTNTLTQKDNVWTLTYVGGSPGPLGETLVHALNRLAGTTGLDADGAANRWAGTTGKSLVGALNVQAGNALPNYKELVGVLNQLAGTTGLGVDGAAAAIPS